MPQNPKHFDLAQIVFYLTLAVAIFMAGGVYMLMRLPPSQLFAEGFRSARTLIRQQLQVRHDLVEETRYAGEGVIRYDPAQAHDGYTLIQGLFAEGVELRLLDMTGDVVRRWAVRFEEIWPDPSHIFPAKNIPVSDFNYHTQGMWALPDGAVVFNVGSYGTVNMDKCGELQWTVDRMTHHSITPNPDGSFWIPVRANIRDVPEDLMLRDVTPESLIDSLGSYEDRLMLVSPDGTITTEISVLGALLQGDFEHDLFDAWEIDKLDPTHVNDIEVVTLPLAEKIEGVQSGDLLVSIRQLHMLAIMDRHSGRIKWHKTGPWVRQHDPDITESGSIEVFNNGAAHLNQNQFRGSSIISLNPTTSETEALYPASENEHFFSSIMGTHQLLGNGNRLISESMAGRVFEIDSDGEIVWEYIRPYDSSHAALIESAIRYDLDYFSVRDWSCTEVG